MAVNYEAGAKQYRPFILCAGNGFSFEVDILAHDVAKFENACIEAYKSLAEMVGVHDNLTPTNHQPEPVIGESGELSFRLDAEYGFKMRCYIPNNSDALFKFATEFGRKAIAMNHKLMLRNQGKQI